MSLMNYKQYDETYNNMEDNARNVYPRTDSICNLLQQPENRFEITNLFSFIEFPIRLLKRHRIYGRLLGMLLSGFPLSDYFTVAVRKRR